MTITRPIRLFLGGLFGGLVAALALGGAGCTTYPSPPSEPAFDTDVLPIFQAHCTRCHGNGPDGGALNAASVPGMVYPDGGGPARAVPPFLTMFGDVCSPLPDGSAGTCLNGADCTHCGALTYHTQIATYLDPNYYQRMPPPPAPLLNDWELSVVKSWLANPVCSNSPHPDPTICPGS
jgi:hypothetical protein